MRQAIIEEASNQMKIKLPNGNILMLSKNEYMAFNLGMFSKKFSNPSGATITGTPRGQGPNPLEFNQASKRNSFQDKDKADIEVFIEPAGYTPSKIIKSKMSDENLQATLDSNRSSPKGFKNNKMDVTNTFVIDDSSSNIALNSLPIVQVTPAAPEATINNESSKYSGNHLAPPKKFKNTMGRRNRRTKTTTSLDKKHKTEGSEDQLDESLEITSQIMTKTPSHQTATTAPLEIIQLNPVILMPIRKIIKSNTKKKTGSPSKMPSKAEDLFNFEDVSTSEVTSRPSTERMK